MNARDFGAVADSLRREVLRFYRERGETLTEQGGLNTLETNSGFVERRAAPLLEILRTDGGVESIEGLRLLDIGCGFGALSTFFAARGAEVIGIDPNEERLQVGRAVAAEHGLPLDLRRGRMQSLELPDESFDLVVQNNTLCYVVPRPERRAALTETLRVLRGGGSLIVRNPNRWNPLDQFTGLPLIQILPPGGANRVAGLFGRRRSTVRLTSSLEAVRELRAAGFVDVRHASPPTRAWPSAMKPFARYQHLVARRSR
jgi:2-polyprenyl-3-methyl-5-hydroxy-6-metoxy-1,4-benzoquinol methylase